MLLLPQDEFQLMPTNHKDCRHIIDSATCVLHIGTPKTGSTAIERFLCENRAQLIRSGILYPASIERGHAHHDLAFLASGSYPEWASQQPRTLTQLLEAITIEAKQCPSPCKLMLSSENFYWLTEPEAVRDLLCELGHLPRQVAVIVYLRRQEIAVESWYNQLVKALGYSGSFKESLNEFDSLWDYQDRLQRWAEVFGPERIIVRTYPDDAQDSFDVRLDFARLIGIDEAACRYGPFRPNGRLLRDVLEFQRIINRLPLPTIDKRRFHKQLIALSSFSSSITLEDAPLHSTATRGLIRQRYEAGNRAVARAFLGRDSLFPVSGTDSTIDGDGGEPAPLSTEKLIWIFAWLLIAETGAGIPALSREAS